MRQPSVEGPRGWGEARGGQRTMTFTSDQPTTRQWMKFGAVKVKVVRGLTTAGTHYLNIMVQGLQGVKDRVGGLLGEADHTEAARKRRSRRPPGPVAGAAGPRPPL